ncbi:hypothetical protein J3R30DRAFT_3399412 [Lentinula aciculospora]|uniref:Uncharacterized protein n=1 Tax=Lentinula aciculospora TaxID=153920 RepID=A0A9W9AT68_9AGAR|nr:hypothetical protein J3R30DRAFT_3399412 [Lentinula aciculospora]
MILFTFRQLFALFGLWVSFFSVAFTLPVISVGSRDTIQLLERGHRFDNNTAILYPKSKNVPVQLWIHERGTDSEHWALVIDTIHGFDAEIQNVYEQFKHPLKPTRFAYKAKKASKLIDLRCEALFKDEAEMKQVFKELVNNVKITKLPWEIGGNCMDYSKDVLEYLVKGKHISRIPSAFTTLWKQDYVKVREKVWGR